jgi:hypothetical protein
MGTATSYPRLLTLSLYRNNSTTAAVEDKSAVEIKAPHSLLAPVAEPAALADGDDEVRSLSQESNVSNASTTRGTKRKSQTPDPVPIPSVVPPTSSSAANIKKRQSKGRTAPIEIDPAVAVSSAAAKRSRR